MEQITHIDLIQDELDRRFTKKILWNIPVVESCRRLGWEQKADKIASCGTWTEWARPNPDEKAYLTFGNFCKDRICQMCSWRRSLKIFGQVSAVMDELQREKDYAFLFLTFTVQNCSSEDLKKTIRQLQNGFEILTQKTKAIQPFKGYFKSLEITTHPENLTKWEYHPHIHAIFAVNKSYFTSQDYISQKKLVALWRQKCKLDYDPIVGIQKIRPQKDKEDEVSLKKAVCEVAKYALKPKNLSYLPYSVIDRELKTLSEALARARVCDFGGVFRKAAQALKLDDMLEGDLTHVNNVRLRTDLTYTIITKRWLPGHGYVTTNIREDTIDKPKRRKHEAAPTD